jgi:hypothetical protein
VSSESHETINSGYVQVPRRRKRQKLAQEHEEDHQMLDTRSAKHWTKGTSECGQEDGRILDRGKISYRKIAEFDGKSVLKYDRI